MSVNNENLVPVNHPQKRVLIVEDEKAMAKAMEIKLQKAGIPADAVFNGEEGIKALQTDKYSVVLLDIMMPRLDGWAVLETIRQQGYKVKVIITSNLSQEEDVRKATDLGAVDFLVKSESSLSQIAEVVKSYL